MNAFAIAVLSCRLLALFVLSQILSALPSLPLTVTAALQANRFVGFSDIGQPDTSIGSPDIIRPLLVTVLLPFFVSASFSAFLWFKAGWLAARMVPASAPMSDAAPLGRDIQPIFLTAIGVLVLVMTIPEAARAIALPLLMPSNVSLGSDQAARATAEHWALLLRFLLGFGLLFGATPLSQALDRLKSD